MTGYRFPGLKALWQHVRTWLGRFAVFGAGQIAVQLLTAVSGFLSVRWLSKSEYSFFTIATSLQFLICHFSDMGVSVGLNSIGGRVWNDAARFGALLNTARRERLRVAVVASLAVVPFTLMLLIRQHCAYGYAMVLTLCSLTAGLCQMESGVYVLAPRFHQRLKALRNLDVVNGLLRLGLLASLLYALPAAIVPVAITAAISFWQLRRYRDWSAQLADRTAGIDPTYRAELRRIVLKLMPSGIFFAFQGQLTVAIIALYGQIGAVADLGALSRLGIIFGVIGTTVANVLMPAFSKLQHLPVLIARFWLILLPITALAVGMVGCAILFPRECLWILGAKYENLAHEVTFIAVSSGLGSIQSTIWAMIAARAWIEWAWLEIPVSLLTLIVCVLLFDLHSVRGALLLGCCTQAANVLSNLFMVWRGFKKHRAESPS